MLPCFGDSIAGNPSREIQSRARMLILATCSRVKVQSRGLHRDFRGSAHDSLVGRPSSREKHLEIFLTFVSLSVLAASPSDLLETHFSCENRVFGKNWVSFLNLFSFPSNFL